MRAAEFGIWSCKACGKQAKATVHQLRKTYCSKDCMAGDYRMRMAGAANPNHKGVGQHACALCGASFHSYNKARKYCSPACYNATRPRASKPKRPAKSGQAPRQFGVWSCQHCGAQRPATANQVKHRFCSRACVFAARSAGALDWRTRPSGVMVYRKCIGCWEWFSQPVHKSKVYCGYRCFVNAGGAVRAGEAAARAIMKYGAKKDANHNEIMAILREGVPVYDMSAQGCGVPDGIAWICEAWHLFDIKNPKTGYGRRGLNPRQKKWIGQWKGGPVYLIYTREDAIAFREGRLSELKRHDSNTEAANDA